MILKTTSLLKGHIFNIPMRKPVPYNVPTVENNFKNASLLYVYFYKKVTA